MKYIKEINLMTKSEMIMYIYLDTYKEKQNYEFNISRELFEELGFSKSRFYEAKHNLMEKGILKQKIDNIYIFCPLKS